MLKYLYRSYLLSSWLLGFLVVNVQWAYRYLVSTEDVLNLERGFYYPSNNDESPLTYSWMANSRTPYVPFGANYQIASSNFFLYFMLSDFINNDIFAAYLQSIKVDFEAVCAAGSKVIIRFSYINTFVFPLPYSNATKVHVLSQIAQLGPVLQGNTEVIAALQLVFFDTRRKGFYTDHFGDAATTSYLSTTKWLGHICIG